MQQWVDQRLAAMRVERMQDSPQLTLGELIRRLEAVPLAFENYKGETEPKLVWFEFGGAYPTHLSSWRGSYAELAIEFDYDGKVAHRCKEEWKAPEYPTAEQFLRRLRSAVGMTFGGYKGGDFTMQEHAPLWVANYGESGNTGVVGLKDRDCAVYIQTAWCKF